MLIDYSILFWCLLWKSLIMNAINGTQLMQLIGKRNVANSFAFNFKVIDKAIVIYEFK